MCIVSAPATVVRLICLCLQPLLIVLAGRLIMLPDDVLLHIFHFVRVAYLDRPRTIDPGWRLSWWHRLVHVSQRWRSVVFESPNFLDLRLICDPWTRVELTGIWPPLPIILRNMVNSPMPEDYDFDAAIVHHNRVREINLLYITNSQLQRLASAMQEQFPALIHLRLDGDYNHPVPALSDGFLGGTAPHLRHLELYSISFPALPKLLLSATDLVHLRIWKIPHSGYFSPEAIVTALAVLPSLESLTIRFESPLSCPNRGRRHSPSPTRIVLPALTRFVFKGVSEYLEDLVARIDAPMLDSIRITFFHQLTFDIPQLALFTRRTTRFQALNEAHLHFGDSGVQVDSLPPTRTFVGLRIACRELDWQLSSLAQVFTPFIPSIYMVEHLYIYGRRNLSPHWQDDIENMQWLEIFYPFTSVKNLYVSKKFARCIAPALKDAGGRLTDVLPTLERLFMEELEPLGPIHEAIGQFVAARNLLGRPVSVFQWNRPRLRRF